MSSVPVQGVGEDVPLDRCHREDDRSRVWSGRWSAVTARRRVCRHSS